MKTYVYVDGFNLYYGTANPRRELQKFASFVKCPFGMAFDLPVNFQPA